MKLIFTFLITLYTLSLSAQEPQPPLHNQFRDFVEFQQNRQQVERPKIERKNGKVTITMTEAQFQRMRRMRMSQRNGFRPIGMNQPMCEKCFNHHRPPMEKPKMKWQE